MIFAFKVGWGKKENENAGGPPKQLKVYPVTNDVCFLKRPEFAKISSLRTFCAGSTQAGPCSGDSG